MKLTQIVELVGVEPKKGNGTFDDGKEWATDRVEVHCLVPLDVKKGAKGVTAAVYRLDGHDQHIENCLSLVGKKVELTLEMVAAKAGMAPKINLVSICKAA